MVHNQPTLLQPACQQVASQLRKLLQEYQELPLCPLHQSQCQCTQHPSQCQCTHLMQADIWEWFLEPSLFGTEVLTLGGSRGPSVSYYVPYLSAMQLLLPTVPRATTPVRPSRAQAGSEAAAPAAGAQRGLRESGRPAHGKVYQLAQEWRGWPAQVSSVACSCRDAVLQGRSCLPRSAAWTCSARA